MWHLLFCLGWGYCGGYRSHEMCHTATTNNEGQTVQKKGNCPHQGETQDAPRLLSTIQSDSTTLGPSKAAATQR
ncbi:hypothetical protein EDB87DRAFT_1225166 [Lactarius vividus]|nr:hypothetical protein EDB87DRAFT_1225166 [Lactarius vividus]